MIVDEAHELTLLIDVVFDLVKDITRFWLDIKLLISSATLDAAKFFHYFDRASMEYTWGTVSCQYFVYKNFGSWWCRSNNCDCAIDSRKTTTRGRFGILHWAKGDWINIWEFETTNMRSRLYSSRNDCITYLCKLLIWHAYKDFWGDTKGSLKGGFSYQYRKHISNYWRY